MIRNKGGDRMDPRFPAAVLAMLVAASILAAGCTGEKGGPQPLPTPLTVTPRRTVTPVPVTPTPVETMATTVPVTPVIPVVAPVWTPGSITQEGSSILIQGPVMGYKAPQGDYLAEIRFTVVKAPRADPVTFEIPSTQIVFKKTGTNPYAVNYLILSGDLNGDRILDPGESFLVSIPFTSDAPQYAIYGGQRFTMTIKNPPQPDIVVATGVPTVLPSDPVVLASA